MKALSIMIKPASGNCNMRCKYCFYADVAENRDIKSYGMISMETSENIVKKAYEYVDSSVTFAFQGGEPMLRGLEYYKEFVELVKKYNTKNIPTHFAIQTNGLLIDENWCEVFKANNFLVGVSIDGYKDIHDANRVDAEQKGTFNRLMKNIQLLNKYKVDYNILCVITKNIARHIDKVYKFYKSKGFKFLQFIPCLDNFDEEPGSSPYSLTADLYGSFLNKLFEHYYNDIVNNDYTSIRYFDNLIRILKGYPPESCDMVGQCSRGTIIEANGDVYPCDFYVLDKWKAGNINEQGFEELRSSSVMDEFVESSKNILPECRQCKYYSICRGGCRRHKEPIVDGQPLENIYCSSYMAFYDKNINRLVDLARHMQ